MLRPLRTNIEFKREEREENTGFHYKIPSWASCPSWL